MKLMYVAAGAAALLSAGCVPTERVSFAAGPQQQSMVRDGRSSIVSKKKGSTIVVSPASREIASGGRPVFIVAIQNTGKAPSEFQVARVSAVQMQGGAPARSIPVIPYERLVSEERTRQVVAAIGVGLAAAGNNINAQNASYYRGGGYSPIAGAINQARADAQNADMVGGAVAQGQLNMAALEQNVIKDNTVLPGEWVGGQLHLEPPSSEGGPKEYVITVPVGAEVHEIVVNQGPSA